MGTRLFVAAGVLALVASGGLAGATHVDAAGHKTINAKEVSGAYRFGPAKTTIKPGTRVTWGNPTDAPHTVTSDSPKWKYDKVFAHGKTVSYTFSKAGTYRYHCQYHPGMVGTIVVKM